MNYEQLLDEIMISTVSAQTLIGDMKQEYHSGLIPWNLEFYTNTLLAGSLLSLNHDKPVLFLIQQENLPQDIIQFVGNLGPHFGKTRQCEEDPLLENIAEVSQQNFYPYLEKILCYLAVINTSSKIQILFIRKKADTKILFPYLKTKTTTMSILGISNLYEGKNKEENIEKSQKLISRFQQQSLQTNEKINFPVINCLSSLTSQERSKQISKLINTGELGLNQEKTLSLRFTMQ